MSWDFSTEPEFQAKLDWMEELLREEIYPLETLALDQAELDRLTAPLKARVREQGLWAAHLSRELGGQGYGQVRLALMNEIVGKSKHGPVVFGNQAPDAGNSEILALYGTEEQKERWLHPLLEGRLRSCFAMTEHGAARIPRCCRQPPSATARSGCSTASSGTRPTRRSPTSSS